MKPFVLLSLFSCILTTTKISGQKNSFTGYYISKAGDSIRGNFPGFRQTERNPNQAEFISHDGKRIILTPQNCNLFKITGYDTYAAYSGQRMTSPLEDLQSTLSNTPDTYDTINTFLRVIYQNNEVTVYSFRDKVRQNFFYKTSGKTITELERKLYSYYAGDNRQTTFINKFRDQLKEEFTQQIEKKKLHARLNSLSFSEKEIVKFMDLLYETNESNKSVKYPAKLFIGTGAAINSLKITGDNSVLETQIDHAPTISPVLVLGAKFYTRRNMGRILISPRLKIFSFKAEGDIDLTSGTANYNHKSEFVAKLIINPSATIGYNIINNPALKWHASAGIGYAFLINSKETQTTTYATPPPTITERNNPSPLVFVFNFETGIDIGNNLGVWLNYQPPGQTSAKASNKSVQFSSFQFGISWSFQIRK